MGRLLVFCCLWLLPCYFGGQVDAFLTREKRDELAQSCFETRQFKEAQEIYEELLANAAFDWQRELLRYNVGCCLLAQGNYQQAIDYLKSNSLAATARIYPLLYHRLKLNLGIALFMQAQSLMALHGMASQQTAIERQAIQLLKEALVQLNFIKASNCKPPWLQGDPECLLSGQTLSAKQKVAHLLDLLMDNQKEKMQQLKMEMEKIANSSYETHGTSPQSLVEEAIAIQEKTVEFLATMQLMAAPQEKIISSDVNALAFAGQQKTVKVISFFPKALLQLQEKLYRQGKCPQKSWNEVLPLYQEGLRFAMSSQKALEEKTRMENVDSILALQKKAIDDWKNALKKMNKQENEQERREKSSSLALGQQIKSQKELFGLLEEMEREDQLTIFPHATQPQPLRPW